MSSPSRRIWLRSSVVIAIHDEQLAEHGGLPAVRSPELLESALSRPVNTAAYADAADTILIGAMYAIGIAHNHPFIDGNKRVAWAAMNTFLELNGITLVFERADAVTAMLALASGERTDDEFIAWVHAHAAR